MNKRQGFLQTVIKLSIALAVVAILVGVPILGRLFVLYPHAPLPWTKPTVPAIDEANIAPELAEYTPFRDLPVSGNGRVIVDVSRANNLQINDLAPLRDRIEARGATVVTHDGSGDPLENQLGTATALVVVAPSVRYDADEQQAIADFVEDGGLLLLAADPTRPVPEEDDFQSIYSIFYRTSAVPAINSLANRFGVIYFDDYLYNLDDNAGNYRHVKFTDFDEGNALIEGLDTVVFFAGHSLRSEGKPLITGDANTHSSVRTGETGLVAAAMAADGQVLALGDITFLTPPHNTIADNDRFLSNIADWLAIDRRLRDDLEDFPYLFGRPVDLVLLGDDDLLDPQLVVGAGTWQAYFERADLALNLGAKADAENDALYVGTFAQSEPVEDTLSDAGITVNVSDDEKDSRSSDKEPDHVAIDGLGSVPIEGTSLFLLTSEEEGDGVTLIVLAQDTEAAIVAMDRLIYGDLYGCVQAGPATLCSTGEEIEEPEESEEDVVEEELSILGSIMIIEDNDKSTGSRTSAAELEAILSPSYDVTVWSIADDGIPGFGDMEGYDAYIIDSGDYASDPDNIDAILAMSGIESGSIMFIGAQPLSMGSDTDTAPLNDLEIADDSHPLADGFDSGDVIALLPSESGVPAVLMTETDIDMGSEVTIVFQRGPESEGAGSPVVAVMAEEYYGESLRLIVAGFTFHRLPEEAQQTFALNAVAWMMSTE